MPWVRVTVRALYHLQLFRFPESLYCALKFNCNVADPLILFFHYCLNTATITVVVVAVVVVTPYSRCAS